MTQTSGSFWAVWSELLYSLPIVLVFIAAVIVCLMNWQKAPTAAMLCLIGFGLICFSSIFGTIINALLISNRGSMSSLVEMLSLVNVGRIIFNVAGFVFLLIAVFQGRNREVRPNLFESPPTQPVPPR